MKKILLMMTIAASLSACDDSTELQELKAKGGEAKYVKMATFRDCEVGQVSWISRSGNWVDTMNVLICPDTQVTNTSYRVGKHDESKAQIGQPKSEEQLKADKERAIEAVKQEALNKLTDDEKKLLGVQ